MERIRLNGNYIHILRLISNIVPKNKYLVLGSCATLAYTSAMGYGRSMHDLDIIIDRKYAASIQNKLLKLGYTQSTFISSRMPFYQQLMKQKAMYVRVSHNGTFVELLITDFVNHQSSVTLTLYPNIWVSIPRAILVQVPYGTATVTTLEVHLLWAIMQLLHNTLGRVVRYKANQRTEDLSVLRQLVDRTKARQLLSQCRFGYRNFWLRVPQLLYP